MTDLREHVIGQWKLGLVQKWITCPITGHVLDIDTVRFVLDPDGDPNLPVSPEGAALIEQGISEGRGLKEGYTLEPARG